MQLQPGASWKSLCSVKKHNAGSVNPEAEHPESGDVTLPERIFSSEFVTVSVDKRNGVLYQTWKGFCPEPEFRKGVDLVIEYMDKNSISKTVSDIRLQKVVSPSCQVYTEERVMDFIRKNGSLHTAFIVAEKSIGDICSKAYDRRICANHGLRINRFFESVGEAESWLREL